MKKRYIVIFLVIPLLLGLGIGYAIGINYERKVLLADLSIIRPIRENDSSYKFINPLLAYIIPGSDQQENFKGLKQKILNFIDAEKKKGKLFDASVFLSDLNAGRWIGVNENQKYNPASILKVVIMVTYFKELEKDADILAKSLGYTSELSQLLEKNSTYSKSVLEIGKNYTVEELIEKMIVDSDNGAEVLLLANINKPILDSLYRVLNIENPEDSFEGFTISPRQYSLFFRVLYSATYLSKGNSEKALDILSKTNFSDGIVAGLPKDTLVSHKFGEYIDSQNNTVELHDCGIVYYNSNPYFLCVMSRGGNLEALKGLLKGISDIVYKNYASQ